MPELNIHRSEVALFLEQGEIIAGKGTKKKGKEKHEE